LKSKLILSGLFLTAAISCSAYRPIVLNAYLDPETTTSNITYEDLNWSYALFNQYGSGLSYTFRIIFTNGNLPALERDTSIFYFDGVTSFFFTDWTVFAPTFVEGELNSVWRQRLNNHLFGRQFDRTTDKADASAILGFRKLTTNNSADNTFVEIRIQSSITYKVSVGSVYSSFSTNSNANITNFEKFIDFRDKQNVTLQTFRLESNPAANQYDRLYNLSTILTNVSSFSLRFFWTDIPPYVVTSTNFIYLFEFNLFTQNQEISIPDDVTGDIFGFEFVAVEWWNILGHLQNFAWWIVNKSPISPLFEWIDTYVITWISGLITFITGVFRL
jgi:hypothetical protein